MPDRCFPPPWIIEEHNNACFIVKDATGQALGYFYLFEAPCEPHHATFVRARSRSSR
jgi:hypothetical protein